MAEKCQRSRNIPKVAEGPLRCGRKGSGAWEQQEGMGATDTSFCDWGRNPRSPSPSMQGRGVNRQCWLCTVSSQVLRLVMGFYMACDALLRGAAV